MGLVRSVMTVGIYTMLSRILGYIRDAVIVSYLGAGAMSDAFNLSVKVPSLFRRLFAEGAFNASFVPIFAGLVSEGKKKEAQRFAEHAGTILAIVLVSLIILIEIFMPQFISLIAPGYEGERYMWGVEFMRITFPFLFFISLTALMGGVLNSYDRFAAPAANQSIANTSIIIMFLASLHMFESYGHAAVWTTPMSGLLQFLWLYFFCANLGIVLRPRKIVLTPEVRKLFKLMLPAIVGSGVMQINLFVDIALSSKLQTGMQTYITMADRVNQLPLSLIGVSMGTALLPLLSRQIRTQNWEDALKTQNRAIEFAITLTLPAAAALIIYADSFTSALFGYGHFDKTAVERTSEALAAFACGLPAFVLIKIFSTGFFARQDTKKPLIAAGVGVVINAFLCYLSVVYLRDIEMGHVGMACALTCSSWVNAVILFVWLRFKGFIELDSRLLTRLPRIGIATALMAIIIYLLEPYFSPVLLDGSLFQRLVAMISLIVVGIIAYLIPAVMLNIVNLKELGVMKKLKTPKV